MSNVGARPRYKPSLDRAAYLNQVCIPMLFLQDSRDKLAEPSLVRTGPQNPGARATLHMVQAADHSFHMPAKSGRTDAQAINELIEVLAKWLNKLKFEMVC